EEEVVATLFSRTTRAVTLIEAGATYLMRVEAILGGARRGRPRGARNGRVMRFAPRRHVVKFHAQGNHPAASRVYEAAPGAEDRARGERPLPRPRDRWHRGGVLVRRPARIERDGAQNHPPAEDTHGLPRLPTGARHAHDAVGPRAPLRDHRSGAPLADFLVPQGRSRHLRAPARAARPRALRALLSLDAAIPSPATALAVAPSLIVIASWLSTRTTCSPTYDERAARFGFRAWMSPRRLRA